ncbi:hypothetical protein TcWFU_008517 [Taenia crassiceps]|uniref:Uncharacterized protein n=1 Tax=Taenia crassiceps TaxID=6207 RepID=A0ABR4Q521_9CEST
MSAPLIDPIFVSSPGSWLKKRPSHRTTDWKVLAAVSFGCHDYHQESRLSLYTPTTTTINTDPVYTYVHVEERRFQEASHARFLSRIESTYLSSRGAEVKSQVTSLSHHLAHDFYQTGQKFEK